MLRESGGLLRKCLVREVKEETGLTHFIQIPRACNIYK